ncbi:UNVERIFIED_CONTAM: hypothetical protein Sradi_2813900 [Sesamum radiatum]|uniref:Transmembrane protein 53 n=1 Tax=Sesamum radiatum TaxID=300843 RepID=A0AAW2RXJ7_SESRA
MSSGGRFYWVRNPGEEFKAKGIVVVFAWVSVSDVQLEDFTGLYSYLGWNSLVCRSDYLNPFIPERATTLAFSVLNELVKELRSGPSPVVFAAFSGGCKACMYKVLQIIEGCSEVELSLGLHAPFLILCSENDDVAPISTQYNFAQRIQELGGNVKVVKWSTTAHLGHYKHESVQYMTAITELLEQAVSTFSEKIQKLEKKSHFDDMHDEISELICDLQNAAVHSNQSFRRVAVGPNDHFFLPSSSECQDRKEFGSVPEDRQERSPHPLSPNSVLGQILFDVCVPKNVEGWDIKFSGSLNGEPFASVRRRSPFGGIKHRSRL